MSGSGRFGRFAADVRHTFYGQALQAALPFFTTPYILHRLGPEAYGLLALVWTLVSQINLLGLGASPAAVKYIAESDASREPRRAARFLRGALLVNAVAGLAGLVLLHAVEPALSGRVLSLPPGLRDAARTLFLCGGAAFLFQSLASAYAAAPRALHRFDVVNAGDAGASTLVQLGSCALLALGFGVTALAGWQAAVAGGALLFYAAWAARLLPGAPLTPALEGGVLGRLVRFGGAVGAAQVAWSVLHQLDKVVVGAYAPMERLTDYIIAFNLASRLMVVLTPVTPVLMPFASRLSGPEDLPHARRLLGSGTKLSLMLLAPPAVLGFFFGPAFLELWLGGRYSEHAGWLLRLLILGHFAWGSTMLAGLMIQGLGRYEGPALLFSALCAAAAASWPVLLPRFGPEAAAGVFLAVHALNAAFLVWWSCRRVLGMSLAGLAAAAARPALGALLLAAACLPLRNSLRGWLELGCFGAAAAAAWAWAAWGWMLDDEERGRLRQAAGL